MAKDMKIKLEEFATGLEGALGDNLVSLCLYGPAVRHDTRDGDRTMSTLLILRDASPKSLRPIEGAVRSWTKKGHPPPLIFSEKGWRGSADVFPIEIEDMREAHLLIRGASPFEDQPTSRQDLRRELEREVRSKLLFLRTEFVAAAADARALESLLLESAGTFFILFRAVLRLLDRHPPQEREPLVLETAEATGMDPAAFAWVLDKLAGRKTSKLVAYDAIGDRYLEQIERLTDFIDAHDSPDAAASDTE